MNIRTTTCTILLVLILLPLLGAGCADGSDRTYPPKPPIPGMQRSPIIERLAP